MSNAFEQISNNTVIISLTLGKPGNTRKVKGNEVEVLSTDEDGEKPDQDMVRVSKVLLNSETLKQIGKKHSSIRRWVDEQCLPSKFMKNGFGILRSTMIPKVNAQLDQDEADIKVLVEQFKQEYPSLVERSMGDLGALADPTNYPSAEKIVSKFVFMRQYLTFDVPRKVLGSISADLVLQEEKKIQEQMQQIVENIEANFVEMFSGLVDHLIECLRPDAEGKKKKVTDKYVERFNGFFDMFAAKDIGTNSELTKIIQETRDLVNGATATEMNKSGNVREHILARMDEIKASIDNTIGSQVSRHIRLPVNQKKLDEATVSVSLEQLTLNTISE